MGKLVLVLSGLLFLFALIGVPNLRLRSDWILPYVTFGLPFILLALGLVLTQLERIETLLKAREPQKPV